MLFLQLEVLDQNNGYKNLSLMICEVAWDHRICSLSMSHLPVTPLTLYLRNWLKTQAKKLIISLFVNTFENIWGNKSKNFVNI